MRVVGIDPGVSGALVVLEDGVPIEWEMMPVITIGRGKRVNAAAVFEFMAHSCCTHVALEFVHAMPKQGVVSMFSFGHAVGTVEGVLGAMSLPYTLVSPNKWKAAAGLIGTDKDAARARAIQLWPRWNALSKKGKGQALADAALIARFYE